MIYADPALIRLMLVMPARKIFFCPLLLSSINFD